MDARLGKFGFECVVVDSEHLGVIQMEGESVENWTKFDSTVVAEAQGFEAINVVGKNIVEAQIAAVVRTVVED